jgi:hypothetical protein
MRPLAFALLVAGCLDFEPGTPDPNQMMTGGSPDMSKPSSPPQPGVDMATSPSNPPQPGADMAGPPPPLGNEVCNVELSLAGTYTQGSAPPLDFPGGCWPDGQWLFTATVTANNGCSPQPPIEAQYSFTVVEDMDYNDTITYNNDPTNMYVATKISGGEGGICTGAFKVYSSDGKTVYNLRPALQVGNILNGSGEIRVYDADQRL